MFSKLWSSVQQDPALVLAVCLVPFVAAAAVTLCLEIRAGRRAKVTTAAELRKDAHTAERRSRVKLLQGRFGSRRAS